ncbi:hypothetical protein [Streptomyces sp. WM6378]|uniref:hypothetical protein n=1 Tax=Streptomyces sp. WM6378 TaxID=1415557 RepID=UPI0006AFD6FB|nr:hypothetical protein [Streptomyces sp. WM6378]KOU43927.1 hypothetical protein ADK54_16895 [Streptomyces sp. WM6378]
MTFSASRAVASAAVGAALVLAATPASAASYDNATPRPLPSTAFRANDWTAPPGFVFDSALLSTPEGCRAKGEKGIAQGKWSAYVCHEQLVQVTDVPLLYQFLYVKR